MRLFPEVIAECFCSVTSMLVNLDYLIAGCPFMFQEVEVLQPCFLPFECSEAMVQ
jgi:hypothetical protein